MPKMTKMVDGIPHYVLTKEDFEPMHRANCGNPECPVCHGKNYEDRTKTIGDVMPDGRVRINNPTEGLFGGHDE
jgi:hypothetical protein